MNVELYEDGIGEFHYSAYMPGVKNARKMAGTLCGLATVGMRPAAWFTLGDRRGAVHYERACVVCRSLLVDSEEPA